jgi:hypothetical protein
MAVRLTPLELGSQQISAPTSGTGDVVASAA